MFQMGGQNEPPKLISPDNENGRKGVHIDTIVWTADPGNPYVPTQTIIRTHIDKAAWTDLIISVQA